MRVPRVRSAGESQVAKTQLPDVSEPLKNSTVDDGCLGVADADGAMNWISDAHER